jgi:uroporphyrinogen-III decarboxylase
MLVNNKVTSITEEPRYAQNIQNWEAFWSLEDIGRPLWVFPMAGTILAMLTRMAPVSQLMKDKVVQLQAELATLGWRDTIEIGDDFVPYLQPQGGVTVVASAFGCEVEYFDHTLPWAHPLIKADDPPEKVYEIKPPAVTDGQLGQMLEFTDYYVAETRGRYPIALTDPQGPLDTAYLVWDSSAFMLAMYTNPKEVHHLMRLVTDLTIAYVKEQRAHSPQFLPCSYPPIWLPDGRGVSMSDDGLAVISAKLYKEFCLPYVNELSEEFGGVTIHSCGNFVHQFDNLANVHNLRGLNFGATETPFAAVWERFNGKTAIIPHLGLNNEVHFGTCREYMEHVLRTKTHNRGLCVIAQPEATEIKPSDPDFVNKFLETARMTVKEFS